MDMVLQRSRRLGLKVSHAVVSHVSDGSSGQRWQLQARYMRDDMLGELLLQRNKGINFGSISGSCGNDLARACADEAVAANLLGGGGFEEEGVLVVGG